MAEPTDSTLPLLPPSALEAVLDRTGALVYAVDTDNTLRTVNAALRARLESDLAGITDLPGFLQSLYPAPALQEEVAAFHRAALSGADTRPVEWGLITGLGETRHVRWTFSLATPNLLIAVGEDVTDRRNLERWVRLQNALLATMEEAIVVADLEGLVMHWTGGAERLFGPDETAALGRPLAGIVPGEGAAATVNEWITLAREKGHATFSRELTAEKGQTINCNVVLSRVQDERGVPAGIALVITPARATPVVAEEFDPGTVGLESALGAVGAVAVVITAMDGTVRGWSAGAERLGSVTAGRARGRKVLDDVLKVTGLAWEGLATRLATRPRYTGRAIVERMNGTKVPVELDAILIRSPEGPQGVVLMLVDRSEAQALADEAVHTKARGLPGAVGEGLARRLVDTLTWFEPDHRAVHAGLHDLVSLGQLVAAGAPAPALEAFLAQTSLPALGEQGWAPIDRLDDGLARLRSLVGDLTRFETTEADAPGPVRVGREVEAARLLIGHRVATNAELVVHLDDLPAARASRGPLLRAVCLLLLAAGESAADVEGGKVTVEGRHHHGWITLEIRDNGAGYAVEVQSRIADQSWLAGQPGHAAFFLGLARESVRLAGGTMELSTAPGTGTHVKLSFPAAEGATAVLPLDPPRPSAAAHGRVLVVEGDELLRRGLERFISELHQVASFSTLADALPQLATATFDGAVVSLTRPEALGLKLLAALGEIAPALAKNTIVLVPTSVRTSTRDALVDRGHLVLTRPFDLTTLRSLLLRLIPPEELSLDEAVD